MVYHWQTQNVKLSGIDDMVLLPKISEDAIVDNLKRRYMDDYIFTCIGPVLISVNPFKQMPYFGEKEIEQYQGAAPYENPPHIYGLADEMYRNMLIDKENQCVIISGESGAGKTVSTKYIMSFITRVSGGGSKVQHVKDVVLESNPLLEAFGNAKTMRNDNSSRFGKYVEILFESGGQPIGGKISNFLLEKSRVVMQNVGERNFHIFYQLCTGGTVKMKREYGLTDLNYYYYLGHDRNHVVDGMHDSKDFLDTQRAMNVMGLTPEDQDKIFRITAAVLHFGNITFQEKQNYAEIVNRQCLSYPSYLLEVNEEQLNSKLISRRFDSKWGAQLDTVNVTLNVEQATYTRDALAKAIYARLFDYLVRKVNEAMLTKEFVQSIGILDIFGFEIFPKNGFEQFCINFVNEKLQQIFIELTLKAEQEEYVAEKIEWTPIDYFNNKTVCDLIESKRPPGIFSILDDVCFTLHAVSSGADADLQKKLHSASKLHEHYEASNDGFIVHHYAGKVFYNVDGFCDKNRDVLFPDLIQLMQNSSSTFVKNLFSEDITIQGKSRPTTVGSKIRSQANALVEKLTLCRPQYIRCIKPNETKKPKDWEEQRVKHQVEYLGLKENIRIRRAGFAYRRTFDKFLYRYGILTKETKNWLGNEKSGVEWIINQLKMKPGQYQLGHSKIFIKAPETLFMLEEQRERKYNFYARIIQRAFKKYYACKQFEKKKLAACLIVFGKKERRRNSLNRNFVGDYIGLDFRPNLLSLVGRREKVFFAEIVKKYDRAFRASRRDLLLTGSHLYLIGREKIKKGPARGTYKEVVKRKLPFEVITLVSISCLCDDFVVIHVKDNYDSLLEIMFKTEFLSCLSKNFQNSLHKNLSLKFSNTIDYRIKKEGWGGGGTRTISFVSVPCGRNAQEIIQTSGKIMTVIVAEGLPSNSRPTNRKSIQTRPVCAPSTHKVANDKNSVGPFLRSPPPPPSEPAPPNQPLISSLQFAFLQKRFRENGTINEVAPDLKNILSPQTGAAGLKGTSLNNSNTKSNLTAEKPKPPVKPKPKSLPKCRALYEYVAQDLDEISFKENDFIELVKEHEGGWWQGRINGKEGVFPANYVEKL